VLQSTYRRVAFWSVLLNGIFGLDKFGSRKPKGKRSNGKPLCVFVSVLVLKYVLNRLWGMKISGMIVRNTRTSRGLLNVTRHLSQHLFFHVTTGRSSSLSRLQDHTQIRDTRYDSSGRVISPSQRPLLDNTQRSHTLCARRDSNPQSQHPDGRRPAT